MTERTGEATTAGASQDKIRENKIKALRESFLRERP